MGMAAKVDFMNELVGRLPFCAIPWFSPVDDVMRLWVRYQGHSWQVTVSDDVLEKGMEDALGEIIAVIENDIESF